MGKFGPEHVLDSADRALLQGFDQPPVWPASVGETERRKMVAQCVPPPFAEQISIAAFGHQVSALERCRLQARLALLDALPDEEVGKSPLTLPSTWIATASDEVMTGLSFRSVAEESRDSPSRGTEVKLGKFGKWKCLGELGWCKASVPDEDHIALIRAQPWLRCIKPPNATETYDEFYKRRQWRC